MHDAPPLMSLDDYEASVRADLISSGIDPHTAVRGVPIGEDEEAIFEVPHESLFLVTGPRHLIEAGSHQSRDPFLRAWRALTRAAFQLASAGSEPAAQ